MASIPDPPAPGGEMAGTGGIGEYEVGAPIREGWGGTIHDGRYRRTGRRVTVQVVRPDLTATAGLVERLGSVGREVATLRDPHLLAVYDLVNDAGSFSLIGEWSAGATIAATLARGSMPTGQAIAALCDVFAGLEALHARGLFHGQVGPETVVVVDGDGRSRLAELALCAAAAPHGFGPHTDVRDTARLGLHMLRKAGTRLDPIRRPLEAAATGAGAADAAQLRVAVEGAAAAVLGPGWRDGESRPVRHQGAGRRRGRALAFIFLAAVVVAGAAVAVVLLVGRGGGAGSAPGPLTIGRDAMLVVTPATAGCNTTFSFVGGGPLSGTGTLVYRWEQSDGQVTADSSVPVDSSEGAFRLTQAWRLQGSQKVDGTMTLHIVKPVDRTLSQTFHYNCP